MNDSGQAAEKRAADFLQQQGLTLLITNYRCRLGEIDLIMQDGQELVFVEVRLRRHAAFGGAGESITRHKQQKLTRAATHYLAEHGSPACRFDAVLLADTVGDKFEWIRNAFDSAWN